MWFSKSHLRILRVLRCFDPLEVSGHAYPSMDHNHHTDDHRKISHLLEHRVTLSPPTWAQQLNRDPVLNNGVSFRI